MNHPIIILFSGYNQRAVVAFLRTLEANHLPYAIVAKSHEDTIWDTVYRANVLAVRTKKELDLDDLFACIDDVLKKTGSQAGFIAPSTEALNRFLLEHRAAFEAINCVIPLIDKDLYEKLSDKYAFCRLCEQHAITIPKESPNMEELVVPFVAKPKTYFTKNQDVFSPQLVLTETDKQTFLQTYQPTDFYYQQYITGESYYLLYYVDRQGKVYAFSQQNLLQQPHGKSIVAAKTSTVHEKPISQAYESMLLTIGFRGLIMIEIKKEGDTYYMIEANPRFWGPSQLFVDANMNFFTAFLWDYGFKTAPPAFDKPVQTYYFWYGGMVTSGKLSMALHAPAGREILEQPVQYLQYDIYNRQDTQTLYHKETTTMTDTEKLLALYANTSKHSNYQILPARLAALIDQEKIHVHTRYEKERLNFIVHHLDVRGKHLVDIGGNSGYFSFELIDAGADHVLYYEGNQAHAEFATLAARVLNLTDRFTAYNRYFSFTDELKEKVDVVLLLNVLHHLGDDYGDPSFSINNAKEAMLDQLNALADKTDYCVFQLGYNWKGNRAIGLFEHGTKAELIDYVRKGTAAHWTIEQIGIAVKSTDTIEYEALNDINGQRDDTMGEFLNRPLFILKSTHACQ